ncbi:dihydrodipicolinate synthase family protein [Aeromicrobium sp. YIM 150415]|uniref:dihydrodipicolinate synthase family protein n=1 Tax=Aeromicrobium sp. YIM 150415 TaxID=2803912 RepID=UPI001963E264|nr:dihydrodipicolinate synthase family protein [Aeromicrobium sp. YIM 150415]MBM9464525.1 dihydrodipicolinate synthase family protein [Aeromicrobium sp. YIM 150415]
MALPYSRGEIKDRARNEWIGACSVTLPSFNEDFSGLNEAGIRFDIARAAELGFWGTLVASESSTTFEEYKRFLEVATEAAPEGFKIVSHLSFDTVDQAVEIGKLSEDLGVEAGLLSYPQSFRPKSAAEVVEHTRYVTDNTDLAMILFAATTWGFKPLDPTGFPIEALVEMSKIDTAAALKYEGGGAALFSALTQVADLCGDNLLVEYPQEMLIPAQQRLLGTRWWGTSAYESFGDRVPKVIDALLADRYEDAMEIFWSYQPAREAKGAFHATFAGAGLIHRQGWKYLSWLNGFNGGQLRMPTMRLQPGQMKALRAGLAASGFDLPADDEGFYQGRVG